VHDNGAEGIAVLTGVRVEESGKVVKEENQLTFRVTSNVPLMQGVSITVSHLVGRNEACAQHTTVSTAQTISLDPAEITFEGAPQPLQSDVNQASLIGNGTQSLCFNDGGHIIMQMPFSVLAGVEVVFVFKVYNWKSRLPGVKPQVAMAGCIAPLTVTGSSAGVADGSSGTSDIAVQVAAVCDGTKTMQLQALAAADLVLASGLRAEIADLEVSEYTPVIAQSNRIYVKLRLSFRLLVGTVMLLEGFGSDEQTSQTADNSALELDGDNVDIVGGNAVWNQAAGTLKLTAAQERGPDQIISFSFALKNAEFQSKARCRMGKAFCSEGSEWEGQPCHVVGGTCAGVCRNGVNFCGDPVIGDCSAFSLPSQQDEANFECPGGVCLVPNNGRQCPPGSMLSSKGTGGPPKNANFTHGYTQSEEQYKGSFTFLDGAKIQVRGVTCDPKGGGTCVGQGICIAPNTGEVCDNHIMCTGVFYPTKRIAGDPFAHRGPALCSRLRPPADIVLTVTQQGISPAPRKARGLVFGVVNPEPPEFKTRTISEETDVASATNVLSVLLGTNFELQAPQDTSLTLSGLSSETASAARMPVMSAQQHLEVFVDCLSSQKSDGQHVVTCLAVGERVLSEDDLIIDARLSLDAKCEWPQVAQGEYCSNSSTPSHSCLLVSGVRVGTTQQAGFSAAPCLERFNCSSDGMCRVMDLLPVSHLLDPTNPSSGSGFVVELNVSRALQVRAKIDLYFTPEYVEWNQATGTVNLTGRSAPSLMLDDHTIAFSFQLMNAATAREAQGITVIGESGVVKNIGICDDIVEPGCTKKGEASTARTVLAGSVLSARTEATFLAAAIVTEDTDIQSARNTITITLAPQYGAGDFTAGSHITISGLGSGVYPSTDALAVASGRVALHAQWTTQGGRLVAEVTSQPARPTAPLIFSFTIRNPERAQTPQRPSAVVVGGWRNAKAWGAGALECKSRPGCGGVLGGGSALGFAMTQVWEKGRQVGEVNPVSLSLMAKVPMLTKPCVLYVHGLYMHQLASGAVQLMGGASLIRRAGKCKGEGRCVMMIDPRPPRGTIPGQLSLDLSVDCRHLRSISAVAVCGQRLPTSALRSGYCTSPSEGSSTLTNVIRDFVIAPCQRQRATVEVSANGLLSVEAVLSIGYAYDESTTTAEWSLLPGSSSDGVLMVKLVPNSSHPMSASVSDAYSFAFKFHARNSPTKVPASTPSITLEYDGFRMPEAQTVDTAVGVLGSGLVAMPAVSFWDAGQVIPSPNSGIFPTGLDCLVVVNAPPGMVTKIQFSDIDLDINTDRLYLIDGDSLLSSRMGGIYDGDKWGAVAGRLGGGFFDMRESFFLSGAPSFGIFLVRSQPPPSAGAGVVPLEASSGQAGVRVTSVLADRDKVDHVIAVISIADAAPLSALGRAKVARQMALLLNIVASRVMAEGSSRRALDDDAHGAVHGAPLGISVREHTMARSGPGGRGGGGAQGETRLRAQQEVALRILAGSPADATALAGKATSLLAGGVLTASLQAAGMPAVSALLSIQIFRCGFELQCVAAEAESTTPPVPVPETSPPPGDKFPIEALVEVCLSFLSLPVHRASSVPVLACCVCWYDAYTRLMWCVTFSLSLFICACMSHAN